METLYWTVKPECIVKPMHELKIRYIENGWVYELYSNNRVKAYKVDKKEHFVYFDNIIGLAND